MALFCLMPNALVYLVLPQLWWTNEGELWRWKIYMTTLKGPHIRSQRDARNKGWRSCRNLSSRTCSFTLTRIAHTPDTSPSNVPATTTIHELAQHPIYQNGITHAILWSQRTLFIVKDIKQWKPDQRFHLFNCTCLPWKQQPHRIIQRVYLMLS